MITKDFHLTFYFRDRLGLLTCFFCKLTYSIGKGSSYIRYMIEDLLYYESKNKVDPVYL